MEKVPEFSYVEPAEYAQARELKLLKKQVYDRLYDELDPNELVLETDDSERSRNQRIAVARHIQRILKEMGISTKDKQKLVAEILDGVISYGPIASFVVDPDITEIMVNKKDQIFIEREGKLEYTNRKFVSTSHLMKIIQRIVYPLGRLINEQNPMVDARLPDGSRVNAIIPPLAVQGPMLTIRKFVTEIVNAQDLVELGSISPEMAKFFQVAVLTRRNIIISGGSGAGKTTLLNVLSSFIPPNERIITIEDAAELRLSQFHIGRLEYRPPDIHGEGEVTIRDLFRNALRMRPDRIIVGECRGAEALDMLQAMNTGHDGSMTTLHANSPKDALSRLETMVAMAGMGIPIGAIRRQIASSIHLIIHVQRYPDGSRKVAKVTEITGIEGEMITRADIFVFKQTGVGEDGMIKGTFESTGIVPKFFEEVRSMGIHLPMDIF